MLKNLKIRFIIVFSLLSANVLRQLMKIFNLRYFRFLLNKFLSNDSYQRSNFFKQHNYKRVKVNIKYLIVQKCQVNMSKRGLTLKEYETLMVELTTCAAGSCGNWTFEPTHLQSEPFPSILF